MSRWLKSGLLRYFDIDAKPPQLLSAQQQQTQQQQQQQPQLCRLSQADLHALATAAVAEDPALAFMLRLDSVVSARGGIVTCVATVRRNVHHHELVYLQRFKQIAEPDIRHPKSRDGQHMMMCLDPKTLKCGQQVLLKLHSRRGPTEPLQLLRECAILRASSGRDSTAAFPRAYLFGCLGNSCWRVTSTDEADRRQLVMYKQHFLLCQYVEDSLQRMLDANRSTGECLKPGAAVRLGREMISRVKLLHTLGWLHCDLRPACFALVGGGEDQLLLSDFASAAPISNSDCLQHDGNSDGGGYKGCRFTSLFADLESLVYILCSFLSPSPLPWEGSADSTNDGKSIGEHKAAVWQFVEAVAASADDEATPDADNDDAAWSVWRLDRVFNCARADVGQHPGFKLAGAIAQLHRETSAGVAVTVKHYDWLANSLR